MVSRGRCAGASGQAVLTEGVRALPSLPPRSQGVEAMRYGFSTQRCDVRVCYRARLGIDQGCEPVSRLVAADCSVQYDALTSRSLPSLSTAGNGQRRQNGSRCSSLSCPYPHDLGCCWAWAWGLERLPRVAAVCSPARRQSERARLPSLLVNVMRLTFCSIRYDTQSQLLPAPTPRPIAPPRA